MSDPNVNDQNMTESDYQANQSGWTPPPFPEGPAEAEEPVPEMSEVQSLASIFYEPSKTFLSFRRTPRFLSATLILLILSTLWFVVYFQKIGFENFIRASIENSPRTESNTPEEKEKMIQMQTLPAVKAFYYASPVIGIFLAIAIGGLIYMAGIKAMGGNAGYFQSVSVWVYSWLPPVVISSLLNYILLFAQSPDSYDVVGGIGGLVKANLSFLVSMKTSPVLYTLLSAFDVFRFFGMFLAAIGLRIVGKISSGAAWAIVLGLWLLGTAISLVVASFGGR